jgi:hypothetical protein
MNTAELTIIYDQNTGEHGWWLVGADDSFAEENGEPTAMGSGMGVAHDLLEHACVDGHGIGGTAEECIALGAAYFVRVQSCHDSLMNIYQAPDHIIANDLGRMIDIDYNGELYAYRSDVRTDIDDELRRVAVLAVKAWHDERVDEYMLEELQEHGGTVPVMSYARAVFACLRTGYAAAVARWNDDCLAAAAEFTTISDEINRHCAAYCSEEFVDELFTLKWDQDSATLSAPLPQCECCYERVDSVSYVDGYGYYCEECADNE